MITSKVFYFNVEYSEQRKLKEDYCLLSLLSKRFILIRKVWNLRDFILTSISY